MCASNMDVNRALSTDSSLAICAFVTPCHASLLYNMPFINIAFLSFQATSVLCLPRGISLIIDTISATIPSPLDFLWLIVSLN